MPMTSVCASLAFAVLAVAAVPEEVTSAGAHVIELAAAEDCHRRCQAIENQCRISSKDLDSSRCTAKFLACVQSCRK